MRARKDNTTWIFLAVAVIALYGGYALMSARANHGDVFPAYSTLRADPQGTKALYESLARVSGLDVERNYFPVDRLHSNNPLTVFFLGDSIPVMNEVSADAVEAVEAFMAVGGRVVITFPSREEAGFSGYWLREREREREQEEADAENENEDAEADPDKKTKKTEYRETWQDSRDVFHEKEPEEGEADEIEDPDERYNPYMRTVTLDTRWGVSFAVRPLELGDEDRVRAAVATREADVAAPATQPWYSGVVFSELSDDWRVIYRRDADPVIIERAIGKGTLVLASDSYFVTNEALRNEPAPELIAWLVGPHARVVFDESHLGLVEDGGVMMLARKYRLHGAIAALALFALLLVWQNAFSLAPPYVLEDVSGIQGSQGREAIAGLQNLLRRYVPQRDLIKTVVDEWKRSQPKGGTGNPAVERVDRRFEAERQRGVSHPVALYNALAQEVHAPKQAVLQGTAKAGAREEKTTPTA